MSEEFSSHPTPEGASSGTAPPRIEGYTLLRCIGRGSYGEVWLARTIMGEWRAVKLVFRQRFASDTHLFDREFKGIKLYEPVSRSDPSLIPILHVGSDEASGCFYYVMELADDAAEAGLENGESGAPVQAERMTAKLRRRLENREDETAVPEFRPEDYTPHTLRGELKRRGRLPTEDCLAIGVALANALEHLHKSKLVHRDIKPSNIIFVEGRAKLADIGLVTDTDASASFVGTMGYVAPEGPGEPAADIFALGKVLYEMATGRDRFDFPGLPSFDGLDAQEQRNLRELNAVILKACARDLSQRYKSAGEMRKELVRLQVGESIERQRKLERAVKLFKVVLAWSVPTAGVVVLFLFNQQLAADRATFFEELRAAQIDRAGGFRPDGWSSKNWATLKRAADGRLEKNEIKAQAAIVMAGLDAKLVASFPKVVGADAAFAPDGRVLVTGDGTQPAMIIRRDGTRTDLPVVSDGKACWAADGTPLIFSLETNVGVLKDAYTGNARRIFPLADEEKVVIQSSSPVLAAAAEGNRLAASVANAVGARVIVWNSASETPLGEIRTNLPHRVTALAFTPDGSILAAGGVDGVTRIYSLPDLKSLGVLKNPVRRNPIQCLAFTRDHLMRPESAPFSTNWLLAVGDQGTELVIWDVSAELPRAFCRGSHWELESVAFSPDGDILASGGRTQPRLWDAHSGELLLTLTAAGMGSDTTALAFSPEGDRLLVGSRTNSSSPVTAIWKLKADRGIRSLRGLTAVVRKIWFSPNANNQRVAALSDQWMLAVWDVQKGRLLYQFEAPTGTTADGAGASFDASGKRLAFATGTSVHLYDLESGRVSAQWDLNEGLSDELQFDARDRLLLLRREFWNGDRSRRVWRLYELKPDTAPKLLFAQSEPSWPAYNVALPLGSEKFVVWSGGERRPGPRTIRVWDIRTGLLLREIDTLMTNNAPRVLVDAKGRWLGYATHEGSPIRLMALDDFREIAVRRDRNFESISPSGDETAGYAWLIQSLNSENDSIPMLDEWLKVFFPPSFSPDGRYLAWGNKRGVVFVADLPAVKSRIKSLVP